MLSCKVCKDSGKGENVWSSHRVRDKNGKVICPTLLSQNCRKCGKIGHTVKFCNIVEKGIKKELSIEKIKKAELGKLSYAAITEMIIEKEEKKEEKVEKKIKYEDLKNINNIKVTSVLKNFKRYTSWADAESSDDDENLELNMYEVELN